MTVSSLYSLRQFKDELLMTLEAFCSHTHLDIGCCIVRIALWIFSICSPSQKPQL